MLHLDYHVCFIMRIVDTRAGCVHRAVPEKTDQRAYRHVNTPGPAIFASVVHLSVLGFMLDPVWWVSPNLLAAD